MFMLFLGWKTSLASSVCTAAGQNSWSEDMKPTERWRESKMHSVLSLHGAAATERSHLVHELSKANQEAVRRGSCSHVSLLHCSSSRPRPHLMTGSWMQSFTFSHQSLMPQSWRTCPFLSYDLTSTKRPFACHALHDNALISSPQRTRCQSDKR